MVLHCIGLKSRDDGYMPPVCLRLCACVSPHCFVTCQARSTSGRAGHVIMCVNVLSCPCLFPANGINIGPSPSSKLLIHSLYCVHLLTNEICLNQRNQNWKSSWEYLACIIIPNKPCSLNYVNTCRIHYIAICIVWSGRDTKQQNNAFQVCPRRQCHCSHAGNAASFRARGKWSVKFLRLLRHCYLKA